jgi:putative hemolysin
MLTTTLRVRGSARTLPTGCRIERAVVDAWPQLLLVASLIVVNAAFAGTELALVSLRESQLQRLEERSRTGAVLARLAREPNRFLATIQIGITLAGFLASAAAAVSLAEPLEGPLGFLGSAARPASILVVTLILSYFTLVFGELAPKRIAMQRAERWGLVMARPLAALSALTRPVVWLLSASTDIVVRLVGGDPLQHREAVTEEELRDMVALQTTFTDEQRRLIDGAFEISERELDQIMVPRGDVVVLDADAACRDGLEVLRESGHSRAPVAEERNLDRTIGVVHLRDLIDGESQPVRAVARELPVFPEAAHVLTVLKELQQRRMQMALVIDEHGGVVGLVTVEDIVEELVGEIYDETDRDLVGVEHESDGTILLPGRFPMHDLPDVGVDLPEGEYATIAGLVLDRLGRIPLVGESVEIDGWQIDVREVDRLAIRLVALRPVEAESSDADEARPGEPGIGTSSRS